MQGFPRASVEEEAVLSANIGALMGSFQGVYKGNYKRSIRVLS